MKSASHFFNELNQRYQLLHRAEGELFWLTHTGQSDDHRGLSAASLARKTFMADAAHLARTRTHLQRLAVAEPSPRRAALIAGLRGWEAVFMRHAVNGARAETMLSDLLALDADLFARRQAYRMHHLGAQGTVEEATTARLRANLANNPDEAARLSSHRALQGLERWVLDNGLLEIVAKRNALGRELGYRNFFEYRLRTNSDMSSAQLLSVFDGFEQRTRASHRASLARLRADHGEQALAPHNLPYWMRNASGQQSATHFPSERTLERWADTFHRMGVGYRGARLAIDLFERPGKFPTGFCITPGLGYVDDETGQSIPDIRMTSVAALKQGQSGRQALTVLFHEAGHAAHFANVSANAPCFGQDQAPTSPALMEAQAKFFDALPSDPCWLRRYTTDAAGAPLDDVALRTEVETHHRWLAHNERRDLVPTYFEHALYELDEAGLTRDTVLDTARHITECVLGVPDSTSYVLAIPHPIYHDIAGYYHGYLLAKMAAAQTRAYLIRTLGHIVDNPAVGPLLAEHCWARGNALTLDQSLLALTGETLTDAYLAQECNLSVDAAWQRAQARLAAMAQAEPGAVSETASQTADLNARITVVHGSAAIATNDVSMQTMYRDFESWVGGQLA